MESNVSSYELIIKSLDIPSFINMDELCMETRLTSRLLYCLSNNTNKYYKIVSIPKKYGGKRTIYIPSFTLKIVQKWILVNILDKVNPSNHSMAFRKGDKYGIKANAKYHAGTLYGLSIDLKDFFPSIPSKKVYYVFKSLGYNDFAATILTNLCTLNGFLPQGAICSPALSNLVCFSMDKRLTGLCAKRGIKYSRYADDMYFSSDNKDQLKRAFKTIQKIINNEGFDLNKDKTHFQTPKNRKLITGIIVPHTLVDEKTQLYASKTLKKKIRSEIFACLVTGNYDKRDHILGEISYVNFIEGHDDAYIARIKKYIENKTKYIDLFPELVDAYNNNRFFKDMNELSVDNWKNLDTFIDIYQNRKEFLEKNHYVDICKYDGIPIN